MHEKAGAGLVKEGLGREEGSGSKRDSKVERQSVLDVQAHGCHDGAGDWSGSEGSFSGCESGRMSFSGPGSHAALGPALPKSAPGSLCDFNMFAGESAASALFDSTYSLLPSTASSLPAQTAPMISQDEVSPFDFPLDPALALGFGELRELEDMSVDLGLPAVEGAFHVEDWSRYLWTAETGFEHLDTGFPLSQ